MGILLIVFFFIAYSNDWNLLNGIFVIKKNWMFLNFSKKYAINIFKKLLQDELKLKVKTIQFEM